MAASSAARLKCMYRCVTPSSECPASSWMAHAGAPRIAKCEQNVCRRRCTIFHVRLPRGPLHPILNLLPSQWRAVALAQHPRASQIRACPSTKRGANSLSVGTSFFGFGGPCWSRCRSRSCPHRAATDLDAVIRFRSRWVLPSGSVMRTSTWYPPRRYGLTFTPIVITFPAMAWTSDGASLAGRPDGRGRGGRSERCRAAACVLPYWCTLFPITLWRISTRSRMVSFPLSARSGPILRGEARLGVVRSFPTHRLWLGIHSVPHRPGRALLGHSNGQGSDHESFQHKNCRLQLTVLLFHLMLSASQVD
jgi:hypothetical protein